MKAKLVWQAPGHEKPRTATILVTPDELATLRYALALDMEKKGNSSASLRTFNPEGRVFKRVYPLRYVLSITPLMKGRTQEE